LLGEHHPDTLASRLHVAQLYWKEGKDREAETLLTELVAFESRALGAEHLSTLEAMHSLAIIYGEEGKWRQSREMNESILRTRRAPSSGSLLRTPA
jgi:hypothetical protein